MRAGAALPAVLLALTMTSAIAVGSAFVSRQYASSARFASSGGELTPLAEAALVDAISTWDSSSRAAQPVGSMVPLATAHPRTRVWITRASPRLFWLMAESATTVRPVLRRRIGVFVRDSIGSPRVVPGPAWTELP
jgi:hypothetical protein